MSIAAKSKGKTKDTKPLKMESKHPLAIRWFHWINFPVLAIMIWSGILIYWANGVLHIGPYVFFAEWFYHPGYQETQPKPGLWELTGRLAEGMS